MSTILKYLSNDKALHALYSCLIVTALSVVVPIWVAIIVAAVIGVAKEIYDHYFGGGWSWGDIIADAVGIVGSVTVLLLL